MVNEEIFTLHFYSNSFWNALELQNH